jgi:hypothetical protein
MKNIFKVLLVTIICFGCSAPEAKDDAVPKDKIVFTSGKQDAVFHVMPFCVGGPGGSTRLIDPLTQNDISFNGLTVFLDRDYDDSITARFPRCGYNSDDVIVEAEIILKEEKGSVSTEEEKILPYYEAQVLKLKRVIVKAEPCN